MTTAPAPRSWRGAMAALAGLALAGLVLAAVALPTGVARATGPSPSAAPPAAQVRTLGPTPHQELVEFDFVLRYEQRALDAFTARVNDPRSPDYHQYASAAELGRRFGLTVEDLERVRSWLDAHGFAVVEAFPQRTTLRVTASAAAVNRALHVTMTDKLDRASHRRFHAPQGVPRVPAALAGLVEGFAELDTRPTSRPHAVVEPRQSTARCAESPDCLTPAKLSRAFDITALHDRGFHGEGQYVAVIMGGPVSDDDLQQFASTGGLRDVPPIERITVGSGPDASESSQPIMRLEGTMDVESIQAVAPQARILYFFAALRAFPDAVNAVVADGRAKIATYSAGGCDDPQYERTAEHRALQAANAAGVNVFASSGDRGAFNCLAFDPYDYRVVASRPSDSEFAISVGGTYLERSAAGDYVGEAAWVEPLVNWSTGGGLAASIPRPLWQRAPGVENQYSNGKRQEPDVAGPADSETGWLIVVNGEEQRSGGTSASSPFWAGLTAIFQQMVVANGQPRLGFLNPTLYALARTSAPNMIFHDIVRGDNLFYPATPGWDFATGLGSPIASALGDAIVAYLADASTGST